MALEIDPKSFGTFEKQAPGPLLLVFLCSQQSSFQAYLPRRNFFVVVDVFAVRAVIHKIRVMWRYRTKSIP